MQNVDHTKNIIEIADISFTYGGVEYAVRDVSFNIHKGDYLGVIGPNGGGKTTLLKIMLGLLKPTKGTVKLFGQDIRAFHDWYKIGYVPQKAISFDARFPVTVEEVVLMGTYAKRGLFHFTTQEDRKKAESALAEVDMLPYKNRQIGDLSSGQQQRIFIARALATQPEIIFLDEPTVGVDVSTQEQFYILLKKLNRELHLTLVLISHELDIVAHEATEVACINGGLINYCTPDELKQKGTLAHLYGKELKYIIHDHGGAED
jgi:zinc transport system ATP-binding protein